MKIGRIAAVTAAVAVGGMVLAGCSAGNGEIQKGTTVVVAQNQGITSLNPNTSDTYSTYNTNVNGMLGAAFFWYDNEPKLVDNTQFGTITQSTPAEDGSFDVTYKIADGVKWSDGTAVDAVDLLLNWVTGYGKYNDDGSGSISPATGVNFTSITAGMIDAVAPDLPKISDDHKTMTVHYSKPYVDWKLVMAGAGMPAHIVAEEAGLVAADAKADDAKQAILDAIDNQDNDALAKIASTWSKGWSVTAMPTDAKLLVNNGPYLLTNVANCGDAGCDSTISANKDYTWGPKPKVDQITFQTIPDQTAQVQALQNGDVSIIYGQATQDTVKALEAVKNATTETDAASTYEHIDLTFNNGGPFDPATYGGDAAKALAVRQAFLLSIPRQDIVDKLIKPINADATLDDSQTLLPGQEGYDESIADNGSADYTDAGTDAAIAKAKSLLADAGVTTPIDVRFLYGKSNTRRAAEYQLIATSAAKSGFNVIDDGDDNWGEILGDGSYDASLFAWAYSSLSPLGAEATFKSDGGNNFNGYKNADLDQAYLSLEQEYDLGKQTALLQQIDKTLWGDAYGVTIFQFPDVTAWANTLTGVSYSPLVPNVYWDPWDWSSTKTTTSVQ